MSDRRDRRLALIEGLKNMTPEEVADMEAYCARLKKHWSPILLDLCKKCNKSFWAERGHSGPIYCPYCGDEVVVFE